MSARINFAQERIGSLIYPPDAPSGGIAEIESNRALKINGHVSAPLVFTGIFSAEECDRIIEIGAGRSKRPGRMMYAHHEIRKSNIAWVGLDSDTDWLYGKVWNTLLAVNRWFAFDLYGLVDEIQLATYAEGDRFDWHLDTGGGQTSTRKISLSVQLTDEAEYTGGDLEFCACSELEPRRRRGTIIAFPSFLAHRVTAVTQGCRASLVAWAHGPVFN
jgi:PKHD-type hydroxylase